MKFVEIGRLACEGHYAAGRKTVTRWLNEHGRNRLVAERAARVQERIEEKRKLKLMAIVMHRAFPVGGRKHVSDALARHAAQHLRKARNGGWIISPTPDGDWWVGSRRRSAAELVELAVSKGFDANLTGAGEADVSSRL